MAELNSVGLESRTPVKSGELIAPVWHTIVLLLFLMSFSGLGALGAHLSSAHTHNHTRGYLLAIAIEWLMVLFVWYGMRLRGARLRELIGSYGSVLGLSDFGVAILFIMASNMILAILAHWLRATHNQATRNLLPSGPHDVWVYLLLALSAGICEEIVCRGYFYRQFAALTKSTWAGLMIQGAIFGAAHGYQGWKFMSILAVYGCMFGLLARWRKSLRPGMIAHALQDGLVGLMQRNLLR